ncbi:MAG: DnaD domain protein [Ruminococcaceae bacterium]|nr:DnaD domain protein [Oscillospiraceae bacterium]
MAKRMMKHGGYVAVPYEFIDQYMCNANGTFVKVYLYAMRYDGAELTDEGIAEALGILESDVLKAWRYWEKQGVVSLENGEVAFHPAQKPMPKPAEEKKSSGKKKYSEQEMVQAMENNQELKFLYSFAQQKLGNIIPPADVNILFSLYDWLKLPVEVIVMLFEYCSEKEKLNMRYIESTAIRWVEQGLRTTEQVEEYCRREEEQKKQYAAFQRMAGISGRTLSQTEKKYIDSWTEQMRFSTEMLQLAYEQTVMNTGQVSMPYMNKILTSWHREGISSPKGVEQAREQYRASKGEKKTVKTNFNQKAVMTEDDLLALEMQERRMKNKSLSPEQ